MGLPRVRCGSCRRPRIRFTRSLTGPFILPSHGTRRRRRGPALTENTPLACRRRGTPQKIPAGGDSSHRRCDTVCRPAPARHGMPTSPGPPHVCQSRAGLFVSGSPDLLVSDPRTRDRPVVYCTTRAHDHQHDLRPTPVVSRRGTGTSAPRTCRKGLTGPKGPRTTAASMLC